MIKLSISHAIAQSVKISLFEELVDNTIEDTQDFPQEIALTGKINMNRKNIMKSIGELFILRISKIKFGRAGHANNSANLFFYCL